MLEVVDMPNNIIKKIPAGIGKAQHLRKLNLTGNDIAKVPKTVGKLKVGRNCWNMFQFRKNGTAIFDQNCVFAPPILIQSVKSVVNTNTVT